LPSTSADEADVLRTVRALFDGMRAGNAEAVRQVFDADARLRTIPPGVRMTDAAGPVDPEAFAQAAGQAASGSWDERIWDTEVRVRGALATVWTPYAFYLDGRLSHCGVNAFQLIRRPRGWRIVSLIDTRRTEGCAVPPDVQPQR
jgi:hypothetical protein